MRTTLIVFLAPSRDQRPRLALNPTQRAELTEIAHARSFPAGYVFRAKLILLLVDGRSYNQIKQHVLTTAPTISH